MGILYPIRGRNVAYLVSDTAIIAVSYAVSYAVRYYQDPGYNPDCLGWKYFGPLMLFFIAANYLFQLYRIMWTHSNISDIYRLVRANAVGFIFFFLFLLISSMDFSPAVLIMTFLLSIVQSVFYRILIRDRASRKGAGAPDKRSVVVHAAAKKKKILIIGAGEAGRVILSEYAKKGLADLIAGFADDDGNKIGTILNGKTVYCKTDGVARLIDEIHINEIIIAMPSVAPEKINRVASTVRRTHRSMPIKVLPPLLELDERKPLSISLRDISMADLIGREEVKVDTGMIEKRVSGRTILITGAGGSIGLEMCRQLLKFNIKKLVAIGRGEFSMYNLIKTLNEYEGFLDPMPEITYRIIDVKDRDLLGAAFNEHRPDIVFHAAAHKHVPLMEYNEAEAVQNNIGGTKNVLELTREYGTGEFVFISTDKAVNPTSIMGATKRVAEIVTGYHHKKWGVKTSIVRFGNVIGSRGSVIPLFMEQIERGGPVTVTHPDVTRYFMSIPEASLLVLNAAAYSSGGELFALDMGRQYRVAEIAQRIIEFYGYKSDDEIKIQYTGLRPGEKMHEDLFYENERLKKTENDKIFILPDNEYFNEDIIESFLNKDLPRIAACSPLQIRKMIKRLVPEFEFDAERDGPSPNTKLVN
jgi:FlaA1/EpsC-like NDP-sugar epimerase